MGRVRIQGIGAGGFSKHIAECPSGERWSAFGSVCGFVVEPKRAISTGRSGADQSFCRVHAARVVRIDFVPLEHRELRFMHPPALPGPERCGDLVNRADAAREETLHRVLGAGAKIEEVTVKGDFGRIKMRIDTRTGDE
jgi:hypothetical protein